MPAFNEAVAALNTLNRDNITEVKSMTAPPPGVRITMEAVCIMLKIQPLMVPNENGMGKRPDYWEKAKKTILNDPKLLDTLKEYPKDDIDPAIIAKITPFTT
jgi:dynein heavy chain